MKTEQHTNCRRNPRAYRATPRTRFSSYFHAFFFLVFHLRSPKYWLFGFVFFFYLFFSDYITQSLRRYARAEFSQHHCNSSSSAPLLYDSLYPRPCALHPVQLYPSCTVNSCVIIIIIITYIILSYTLDETTERARKPTTRACSYIIL